MKKLLLASVLTASLLGCGGGDGSSDPIGGNIGPDGTGSEAVFVEASPDLTGNFQFIGFVEIIQDDLENRVNRDANFLQLTESQDAAVFRNSVPLAVDSCQLSVTPTIPTNVGVIGFPEANFNFVSAGESFTLSGEAGTYATVTLSDSRFDIAPFPVPAALTLDIPGAQFPAFADVAVPTVVAVQNFQPGNNETVQADSVISWTPTGLEDHVINLEAFDIVASDKVVDLRCLVADDGEFSLPADIVETLNGSLGAGFSLSGLQQDTRTDSLFISGDALLVVSNSIQAF